MSWPSGYQVGCKWAELGLAMYDAPYIDASGWPGLMLNQMKAIAIVGEISYIEDIWWRYVKVFVASFACVYFNHISRCFMLNCCMFSCSVAQWNEHINPTHETIPTNKALTETRHHPSFQPLGLTSQNYPCKTTGEASIPPVVQPCFGTCHVIPPWKKCLSKKKSSIEAIPIGFVKIPVTVNYFSWDDFSGCRATLRRGVLFLFFFRRKGIFMKGIAKKKQPLSKMRGIFHGCLVLFLDEIWPGSWYT